MTQWGWKGETAHRLHLTNRSYHENEQVNIIISGVRAHVCVHVCVYVHICVCVRRRMRGVNINPGGQMTPIYHNAAQPQMKGVS